MSQPESYKNIFPQMTCTSMFIATFFSKYPLTGNSPGAHQQENGKTKNGLFTQ